MVYRKDLSAEGSFTQSKITVHRMIKKYRAISSPSTQYRVTLCVDGNTKLSLIKSII